MKTRLKQAAVVLAAMLVAAQLIRPSRTNPQTDSSHTIQAQLGPASALPAVLDRSCRDCHSNATVWRWYTNVAPVSWLMVYAVNEGRRVVNFSEWASYTAEQQQALLAQSCSAVSAGRMPGAYTLVDSSTKLSAQNIDTICAASRQALRATNAR